MNKSEKAPREFWIIDETPYSTWVSSKPLPSADTKEEIHVIEYFAFEAKCAQLENALKEIDDHGAEWEAICNQNHRADKLQAQLEIALRALRQLVADGSTYAGKTLDDIAKLSGKS